MDDRARQAVARFHVICGRLRQNDASLTTVDTSEMPAMTNEYAQPLVQALKGNSVVTELLLILNGMSLASARGFADFIEHSRFLRELRFRFDREAALLDALLRGAGRSSTIAHLDLLGCHCSALAFADCLSGNLRNSLEYLWPPRRFSGDDEHDPAIMGQVAGAVRNLTSLDTLTLYDCSHDMQIAFLEVATDHPSLTLLYVDCFNQGIAASTCNVLRSSTRLDLLGLKGCDHLATVLPDLRDHPSVSVLDIFVLDDELNDDEETVGMRIANLLRNILSIRELQVGRITPRVATEILRALVGGNANHSLQKLTLKCHPELRGTAAEQEAFWEFLIDNVAAVMGLAPQLEELRLAGFPQPGDELIPRLVGAFEQNASLFSVEIDCLPDTWKEAMHYFGKRNKYGPVLQGGASPVALLPTIFAKLQVECDNDRDTIDEYERGHAYTECTAYSAASVMYDTLRDRISDIFLNQQRN